MLSREFLYFLLYLLVGAGVSLWWVQDTKKKSSGQVDDIPDSGWNAFLVIATFAWPLFLVIDIYMWIRNFFEGSRKDQRL